jgi:hypothetical protein
MKNIAVIDVQTEAFFKKCNCIYIPSLGAGMTASRNQLIRHQIPEKTGIFIQNQKNRGIYKGEKQDRY